MQYLLYCSYILTLYKYSTVLVLRIMFSTNCTYRIEYPVDDMARAGVTRLFIRSMSDISGFEALAVRSTTPIVAKKEKPIGSIFGGTRTEVGGYTMSGFVINGVRMDGAVLLMPKLRLFFSIQHVNELTARSLEVLRLCDVQKPLLLVGSGRELIRPAAPVREWAEQNDIAIESMPTPKACSTFNFMVQEYRTVAAILFPMVPMAERRSPLVEATRS